MRNGLRNVELDQVDSMKGVEFEKYVGALLEGCGFQKIRYTGSFKDNEMFDALAANGFNTPDFLPLPSDGSRTKGNGQAVFVRDESSEPVRFGMGYEQTRVMDGDEVWMDTWRYVREI